MYRSVAILRIIGLLVSAGNLTMHGWTERDIVDEEDNDLEENWGTRWRYGVWVIRMVGALWDGYNYDEEGPVEMKKPVARCRGTRWCLG